MQGGGTDLDPERLRRLADLLNLPIGEGDSKPRRRELAHDHLAAVVVVRALAAAAAAERVTLNDQNRWRTIDQTTVLSKRAAGASLRRGCCALSALRLAGGFRRHHTSKTEVRGTRIESLE